MKTNIFFDLDSTLVTIEGIDLLAQLKGLADEIIPITNSAMNGEIPMQIAMKKKIDRIQPSRQDILAIGQAYLENFTFGAKDTVQQLQGLGCNCWILSGGFYEAACMVAKSLNIDSNHVIANQIDFAEDGSFRGFDYLKNPLAANGGKIHSLKKLAIDLNQVAMIGDGNTDLETQDHVGLFIGFGGVVQRPKIAACANIYVSDPDLREIIPYITTWQTTNR